MLTISVTGIVVTLSKSDVVSAMPGMQQAQNQAVQQPMATAAAPQQATQAPAAQQAAPAPVQGATQAAGSDTAAAASTTSAAASAQNAPQTTEEILQTFNNAVNTLKNGSVGFNKSKNTATEDIQLSNSLAQSFVSMAKDSLLSNTTEDLQIARGDTAAAVANVSPSGKSYVS